MYMQNHTYVNPSQMSTVNTQILSHSYSDQNAGHDCCIQANPAIRNSVKKDNY